MESLGQWLRQEREARNISVEEIASATKIGSRYLEALEADRLDRMPGGFFIKGIIRNYARAVGLDPDEVLGRYKAAGLLSEPDRGLNPVPKPSSVPVPQIELAPVVPPAAVPDLPAAPAVPSEPAPPPVEEAAPSLLIEEAPKPERSPVSRKQILAWAGRALAVVLVLAVFYVLLSPRRPRPSQTQPQSKPEAVATQSVLPPAQKSEPRSATALPPPEPGPAPESKTAVEPAPKTEAPPVVEDVWKGVTIEIIFQADTWIQVYADGNLKISGAFPAGATARAQADEKVLIQTYNAGGFTFRLNGKPAKPLGRAGQFLSDVIITPENLKDFLEVPSSGLPTG
jgi:cytoskeleton protein RodZ